jgi:hypothetical protein
MTPGQAAGVNAAAQDTNTRTRGDIILSDWGAGFATGIAVGLAIGLTMVRRRKPWSELTDKEKRLMIWLIAAGVVLLAGGIVAFLLVAK